MFISVLKRHASNPKDKSTSMLNVVEQNWCNQGIVTNKTGKGGFPEARSDSYDGVVTLTGMFL